MEEEFDVVDVANEQAWQSFLVMLTVVVDLVLCILSGKWQFLDNTTVCEGSWER